MMETQWTTHSPEETAEKAGLLLKDALASPQAIQAGIVFALYGDLGSGKTCFAQGIASALGIRQVVTSPTFIIMNEYRGTLCGFRHIDLYRLERPEDALAIGIEECMDSPGITAIEWAERAGDLIPDRAIHVRFQSQPGLDERLITVQRK